VAKRIKIINFGEAERTFNNYSQVIKLKVANAV